MKKYKSTFIGIIALGFVHAQAIGQTNGIILQLLFPDAPLLCAEESSIHLSVRNESDHPLPIVTSLQEAIRTQVKVDLGYTSQRYRTLRYSQSAPWDTIVGMADKMLAPGQSHAWDWTEPNNFIAYTELLHSLSGLMVTNITVILFMTNRHSISQGE